MLQYPTNIYPENVAVDTNATDDTKYIKFTFNGDFLSTATFYVYDCTINERLDVISHRSPVPREVIAYNGDELKIIRGALTNGHDYLLQMVLTQCNSDGTDNIYDMPVLHGTLQNFATAGYTVLHIEDKISDIYGFPITVSPRVPITYGGYIAAGMIIKVNGESHFIESYDYDTGDLTIDSGFSFSMEEGTKYQIYSNYLITPQYYFKCRSTPTITPTITPITDDVRHGDFYCTATYSQNENSLIKYYNLKLYRTSFDLSGDSITDVYESGKIYSQKIEYYFGNVMRPEYPETETTVPITLRLVCDIVTQDDMTTSAETTLTINYSTDSYTPNETILWTDKEKHLSGIDYKGSSTTSSDDIDIRVKCVDKNSNDMWTIPHFSIANGYIRAVNYLTSTHGDYDYYVVGYKTGTKALLDGGVKKELHTEFNGYTITAITKIDNPYQSSEKFKDKFLGKYIYSVGDTWKFVGEIDDTTVTQNTDKALHVGYSQFPTVSSTDVDYLSGTLSAMIGYVNCTNKEYVDDITLVKAWRKFITQPCQFILKSQKGDVWIVNITDSPTTEYQESYYKVPTRFSFSWAECAKASDIIVIDDSEIILG